MGQDQTELSVPSKIEGIDMEAYDPKLLPKEYHKLTEDCGLKEKNGGQVPD